MDKQKNRLSEESHNCKVDTLENRLLSKIV